MRQSEKAAADYVTVHGEEVVNMTLSELSKLLNTSETTILRFCRAMDYEGFSDMKLSLARGLAAKSLSKNEHPQLGISPDAALDDIPPRIIARSVAALEDTLKILKLPDFKRAVEILRACKDIFFFGVANSASVADDAMNKFIRLEKRCHVFSDSHLQVMAASGLTPSDVVIGISHSGRTKETIDALRLAKQRNAKIIAITNYSASLITEVSDISLLTADFETGFYSETMASRICQLAIIDMLYVGVMLGDYEKNIARLDALNENLRQHAY